MAETPSLTTRTIEERGVTLRWEEWTPAKVINADGHDCTPERPDPPQLLRSGNVFVPMADLEALAEQGPWDSQFGTALLLDYPTKLAVTAIGWAEAETGGSVHGTDALRRWMNNTGDYDFDMEDSP